MIYFIGKKVDFNGVENSTLEYLREYFKDKSEIGFDTETEGFDVFTDKLLSYQLGNRVHQFVIDASIYPIELIKDLLEEKELLIHNAKFDLKFLYHQNIFPKKIWDTYLGECVIYKGDKTVRKSLEAAVHRYFNYGLTKSSRGLIFREGFTKRVIEYCAEDTTYLPDLKEVQWNRLNKLELLNSMALENLFVKVLTYIEYSGIFVDKKLWAKKVLQDTELRDKSIIELNNWLIDNNIDQYIDTQLDLFNTDIHTTISWSSPKQVVELFNKLGINTKVKDDKTGELKDSVEAPVLEKQKDKSPIIPIYLKYKKYEKILSTYGDTLYSKINPVTGRIHTQFNQIMTTGRMSSGGKLGDKETINLQNIPALPDKKDRVEGKIYERDCFTCEPGNVLVNADYSGQEQVIFANWTLDPDILEFYRKDLGDMHSYVASKIFPHLKDVPLKEIKVKYKDDRQKAKSAGFAIIFGGDGSTLSENLNISKEEGDEIYNSYFKAFPGVNNYFKKATKQALRDGYILFNSISKSKLFIHFFSIYKDLESKVYHAGFWETYRNEKELDSDLYKNDLKPLVSTYFKLRGKISRLALNAPIQGSAAEISKLAGIYMFEYIMNNNLFNIVKFSDIIHDEVLLECPREIGETIAKMVGDCMCRAGNVYCKVIPLKAETQICEFWNH